MTLRLPIVLLTALLLGSPPGARVAAAAMPGALPVQPPRGADERPEEDEQGSELDLYEQAYSALDESDWTEAIERFRAVVERAGTRMDAAMYWSAYAQHRLGLGAEALETLSELEAGFPASRYLADARALAVEVREQGGQPPDPEQLADDDLRLLALQGLMRRDPERAMPMLEAMLTGAQAPQLKAKALSVLAWVETPAARELLTRVARGGFTPDLQLAAIRYLGMNDAEGNRTLLAEIYDGTDDVAVKGRVLRAFMMSGDQARVLAAATGEADPELRGQAIRLLGMMGATEALRGLYEQDAPREQKLQVLRAMFLGGDAEWLVGLLGHETDAELRMAIVRSLGMIGDTAEVLRETYAGETDTTVRRAVIQALFIQQADGALVDLARSETDRELLRDIVRKLSRMDGDDAVEYLLEILER